MGQGYNRNDTSNNIADGNVVNAADFDGEYDAIESAFAAGTGHTHDGTAGEGGPVSVLGPAQDWIATSGALYPKTDNAYDVGSVTNEVKDLYVDGVANIDSLVADTADINGGTVDGAVIGGTTPAAITGTTITANAGFVGSLTGTASAATLATQAVQLQTGRTFSLTGDVTAPAVSFNGTGNVALVTTIDPDLSAIAALSWSSDEAPVYHTGAWQKMSVTGYSRTLLGSADAATARSTLAVPGVAATAAITGTWTGIGQGITMIAKKTASSSASLIFTEFNSGLYDSYIFVLSGIKSSSTATDSLSAEESTNGGSSYLTGGTDYNYLYKDTTWVGSPVESSAGGVTSRVPLSNTQRSLVSDPGFMGTLSLINRTNSFYDWKANYYDAGDGLQTRDGQTLGTTGVNALRFKFVSGNIASGTITMYGLRNS